MLKKLDDATSYARLTEAVRQAVSPRNARPLVQVQPSKEWDELKTRIPVELDTEWIFRGQGRLSWSLQTTLERDLSNAPDERRNVEDQLLHLFRQSAHNYLAPGQRPACRLDWLGAMQHHGAPTRLLDFTRSFYVAVYFAVEQCGDDEDCALWAVHERGFHDAALQRLAAQDFSSEYHLSECLARWIYPDVDSATPAEGVWAALPFAAPAGLQEMSPRQLAQQAAFMLPGDPAQSFEDNMRATFDNPEDVKRHVRCYRISRTARGEILADLRRMNITRASLYPGLDGYTQALKYLLAEPSPQRRAALAAMRGDSSKWADEWSRAFEALLKRAVVQPPSSGE